MAASTPSGSALRDESIVDGLLTIELVREISKEMKPRRIQIGTNPALTRTEAPRRIESDQQVA